MTLDEDKDQSKCYLSYRKPPVLKRTNRDINVVEWANVPNLSTLDYLVTHLRLLEVFFEDVLVDMIFGYTKMECHRETADTSFEIVNEKIRLF